MAILDQLKLTNPRVFENITYDLLGLMGLVNLIWRTPGADGGRDIEGQLPITEFSSIQRTELWYIECKRYDTSLNWATVRDKVYHAELRGADYLLFITTSSFSTQCLDNVEAWNKKHKFPKIRCWPGYDLQEKLEKYPSVLLKHGLKTTAPIQAPAFLDLMLQLAGVTSAALGRDSILNTGEENKELVFAATLSDLLLARMEQFGATQTTARVPFNLNNDRFDWAHFSGNTYPFDKYAFRAILSLLNLLAGSEDWTIPQANNESVEIILSSLNPTKPNRDLFRLLSFWGHMETSLTQGKLTIKNA